MNTHEKAFLLDMDGVLVRGNTPIPGAQEFLGRLEAAGKPYLILTNNPFFTPRDLAHRLAAQGLEIPETHLFTSAMATANFLATQRPNSTAYVIGESGLTEALHQAGYTITANNPEYFVLGETTNYSYESITMAIRLVKGGARFIATNPDTSGPAEQGIVPACGALAKLIQEASGVAPYFIGKPNPLMMRSALHYLGVHSENAIMVGDRMDTDIIAGMEAGMDTILVLTGVTDITEIERFAYRPTLVVKSVAEIIL